ncbi:hypothetical protein CO230_06600 [Chryseobacterium sp. 6424]|uniref:hypothetical protein n=1 Tax=Chryseobacterium sp. 6424 TaxID=2039166 RepID=UPI000EFB876A|nr:hypothetical protein [Chryseobacterium sp. 6424]AYO57820.1 hypothetical protein CO230_06600 [Chryseobacterium sp. 6424]
MKNFLVLLGLISGSLALSAQVIIGDATGTATDKTSVLLEFAATGDRGIILPYVTDKSAITTPGTIVLDASVPTAAFVKVFNGTTWENLTVQHSNVSAALALQAGTTEQNGAKAIIGSTASSADGVLVLESNTKAMVLPMTNAYQNIVNPAPGTMVLLRNAELMVLAVYNGTEWSFWSY